MRRSFAVMTTVSPFNSTSVSRAGDATGEGVTAAGFLTATFVGVMNFPFTDLIVLADAAGFLCVALGAIAWHQLGDRIE
eukprot:6618256-Pyramimonas_sp.AAC.1